MNISDEAVEAAAAAIQVRFDKTMGLNALARATLEAAASILLADNETCCCGVCGL